MDLAREQKLVTYIIIHALRYRLLQYITLYAIRILRTLRTHTRVNSVMRLCSLLGYE